MLFIPLLENHAVVGSSGRHDTHCSPDSWKTTIVIGPSMLKKCDDKTWNHSRIETWTIWFSNISFLDGEYESFNLIIKDFQNGNQKIVGFCCSTGAVPVHFLYWTESKFTDLFYRDFVEATQPLDIGSTPIQMGGWRYTPRCKDVHEQMKYGSVEYNTVKPKIRFPEILSTHEVGNSIEFCNFVFEDPALVRYYKQRSNRAEVGSIDVTVTPCSISGVKTPLRFDQFIIVRPSGIRNCGTNIWVYCLTWMWTFREHQTTWWWPRCCPGC